jgi:hypothetical protein
VRRRLENGVSDRDVMTVDAGSISLCWSFVIRVTDASSQLACCVKAHTLTINEYSLRLNSERDSTVCMYVPPTPSVSRTHDAVLSIAYRLYLYTI